MVGEAPSGPRLGDGRVVNRGPKLNAGRRDFPLQAANRSPVVLTAKDHAPYAVCEYDVIEGRAYLTQL